MVAIRVPVAGVLLTRDCYFLLTLECSIVAGGRYFMYLMYYDYGLLRDEA